MQPHNCNHGSAWHAWQTAGYAWKQLNPSADIQETESAATRWANQDPWPDLGKAARYRAFIEGTKID